MLSFASLFVGGTALTLIGCAALQDVRERLIANRFSLLLLPLALLNHATVAESLLQWLTLSGGALMLAAAVFLVGYLLWRLGGLGGGDVKLLTAAAFFVGLDGAVLLLVGTVLAGGVLALAWLIVPALSPAVTALISGPRTPVCVNGRRSIPYGVAIAAGAACAIVPSLPTVIG